MKKILFVFLSLAIVSAAFVMGWQSRPTKTDRPSASLVCLYRDSALRESPTGYVIVRLPTGTQMYLTRVEAPFAYVSYFDGKQWIEGSVTASYLGPCTQSELRREG